MTAFAEEEVNLRNSFRHETAKKEGVREERKSEGLLTSGERNVGVVFLGKSWSARGSFYSAQRPVKTAIKKAREKWTFHYQSY